MTEGSSDREASPPRNVALFRQLDQMAKELRHERTLRQSAIESARKSQRDKDQLRARIREATLKAEAAAAATDNAPEEAVRVLIETYNALLAADDESEEGDPSIQPSLSQPECTASDASTMEEAAARPEPSASMVDAVVECADVVPCADNSGEALTAAEGGSDSMPHAAETARSAASEPVLRVAEPIVPAKEWAPNSSRCSLCQASFSLFKRRHHCRRCGECVCSNCSPFRVHLESYAERPSRRRSTTFGGIEQSSVSSAKGWVSMRRPEAHRICTHCHGAGAGSFMVPAF